MVSNGEPLHLESIKADIWAVVQHVRRSAVIGHTSPSAVLAAADRLASLDDAPVPVAERTGGTSNRYMAVRKALAAADRSHTAYSTTWQEIGRLLAEYDRLVAEVESLRRQVAEQRELANRFGDEKSAPLAESARLAGRERDVIEAAKAWRAVLKEIAEEEGGPDDDWDGPKHMDAAHALVAAVDALSQPEEETGAPVAVSDR